MTLFLALAFVITALAVWIFQRAMTSPRPVRLPASPEHPIRVEPRLTEEHAEEIAPADPVHIPEAENPVAPSLGQRLDVIERTRRECETDTLGQLRLQMDTVSKLLESIRIQLLCLQLLEEIGYGMHPIQDS